MQRVKLVIPLFAFLNFKAYSQNFDQPVIYKEIAEKELINKPFPQFILSNDSVKWTNKDLLGKTVYINFWFSACFPCMKEMPDVNELYEKFKNDTNFALVSITDEGPDKIALIKEKFKIDY